MLIDQEMDFFRSKSERLADHLRECIARGDLVEPLPGIREWSAQLGVGCHALEGALKILERRSLVKIRPRSGVQLLRRESAAEISPVARVVRWVCYQRDFPDLSGLMEVFGVMAAWLSQHEIRLSIERCSAPKLRAIHARGEVGHEMFLMASLPREFQALFFDFRRSVLLIGEPIPGISLPYLTVDVHAAIRHATHRLARHGFSRISLVVNERHRIPTTDTFFQRVCAELPRPVEGDVIRLPMSVGEQAAAAQRLAVRLVGRQGLIALYAIPATTLISALMKQGVNVPEQVEVVAVNTTLAAIRVAPVPAYYPYPVEAFAKTICRAALHYFAQGTVPPLRKTIPLEIVRPN